MTYNERIAVLQEQHSRLDKQVSLMEQTLGHNPEDLAHLKKKKLAIKDEIGRLRRQEYEESQTITWDDDR